MMHEGCGEAFQEKHALTVTRHALGAQARWPGGCRKTLAAAATFGALSDPQGTRMLPLSALPSIASSPLTPPTFSPPPPQESSPLSSQQPVSSSHPLYQIEQQISATENPIPDVTNAVLHLRLLTAEQLIIEMQSEIKALQRAVQDSGATPPSDRNKDFDWSLDE